MGHEAVVAQNRTPGDAAIGARRRKVAQPLRCTDFNEDYCKQSGGKGVLTAGFSGSGRRRDGLAVMAFFLTISQPVRVLL
jgi:hypothetical protein